MPSLPCMRWCERQAVGWRPHWYTLSLSAVCQRPGTAQLSTTHPGNRNTQSQYTCERQAVGWRPHWYMLSLSAVCKRPGTAQLSTTHPGIRNTQSQYTCERQDVGWRPRWYTLSLSAVCQRPGTAQLSTTHPRRNTQSQYTCERQDVGWRPHWYTLSLSAVCQRPGTAQLSTTHPGIRNTQSQYTCERQAVGRRPHWYTLLLSAVCQRPGTAQLSTTHPRSRNTLTIPMYTWSLHNTVVHHGSETSSHVSRSRIYCHGYIVMPLVLLLLMLWSLVLSKYHQESTSIHIWMPLTRSDMPNRPSLTMPVTPGSHDCRVLHYNIIRLDVHCPGSLRTLTELNPDLWLDGPHLLWPGLHLRPAADRRRRLRQRLLNARHCHQGLGQQRAWPINSLVTHRWRHFTCVGGSTLKSNLV